MVTILGKLRRLLVPIPLVGPAVQRLYAWYISRNFASSENYWTERYAGGGNSGEGSYDKLAEFKAEIVNSFVTSHSITSVIEFGCGDGNQLLFANYPQYIGFDISPDALSHCKQLFQHDLTKSFRQMQDYAGEKAELILSLDVIYHLVEDNVFDAYMRRLFSASMQYVIIYSSNRLEQGINQYPHVKHRLFTDWVDTYLPKWRLLQHIPNRYPLQSNSTGGSFADFYIFEQTGSSK